jgi:hypothetical protein
MRRNPLKRGEEVSAADDRWRMVSLDRSRYRTWLPQRIVQVVARRARMR